MELSLKNFFGVITLMLVILIVAGLLFFFGPLINSKHQRAIMGKPVVFNISKDNYKVTKLDNGLTIVAYKDSSRPKVFVEMAYHIGSAHETSKERGLAHLLEHLIFKGTQKLSEQDINLIAKKFGAELNAYTYNDGTVYWFNCASKDWPVFLDILVDCSKNSRFEEEHLASELKTVIQELNWGRERVEKILWYNACNMVFPANHPYHFPVIGFKEELAKITAADVKAFYEKHYQPKDATLFILGDIDLEGATALAAEKLSDLTNKTAESFEPIIPAPLINTEDVSQTIYHEVGKPEVCYIWDLSGATDKDEAIAEVAHAIIADGNSSRLKQRLVDHDQTAYSVSVGASLLKYGGLTMLRVQPKEGCEAKCEEIIKEELEKIIQGKVKQEEISQKLPLIVKNFVLELDYMSALAQKWTMHHIRTRRIEDFFSYVDEVQKVTTKDVSNFVEKFMSPYSLRKIIVRPITENKKDAWIENKRIIEAAENKILENHVRTTPIEEPSFLYQVGEPELQDFKFAEPDSVEEKPGFKVILKKEDRLPITNFKLGFLNSKKIAGTYEDKKLMIMMQMLEEGSLGYSKQDNSEFFSAMGAIVSFSNQGIFINCLSSNFEAVLERVLFMLKNPTFKQDALQKVLAVAIAQIEQTKKSPFAVLLNNYKNQLFKNTELEINFDESIAFYKNISQKDLVTTYNNLSPKNFVCAVTGNFEKDKAIDLLEKNLKSWHANVEVENKEMIAPQFDNSKTSGVDSELMTDQAHVLFASPINVNSKHEDYHLLQLASSAAFAGMGSRWFKIREQTGLFYSFRGDFVSQSPIQRDDFKSQVMYTWFTPDKLELGIKTFRDEFEKLAVGNFSENEINAAKTELFNGIVSLSASMIDLANMFVTFEINEHPMTRLNDYWNLLKNASAQQVNQALNRHFDPSNFKLYRVVHPSLFKSLNHN